MTPPRLALHTWTLDTTPLDVALDAARVAGWDGVELRAVDFERARQAGEEPGAVIARVRARGLAVACVGARPGWMWADGPERDALLAILSASCAAAAAAGCATVMSPADGGRGDVRRAAASVREAGDIARSHGVRLAIEPPSQAEQLSALDRVGEVLALAGHPACGVLVDLYHVQRAGDWGALAALPGPAIAHVQFSDVPPDTRPGFVLDRLPPGAGVVPFRDAFALLAAKGYQGFLSYEAPCEAAWKRPAADVAAEAMAATRRLLPA